MVETNTQVWILSGSLAVMAVILSFAAKIITQSVLKKLEDIICELQKLSVNSSTQEERIKYLQDHSISATIRLDDHTERLYKLEYHAKENKPNHVY